MTIVDFLIIAFAIFMVIKAMNAAQQARNEPEPEPEAEPEAPPDPSAEEKLLTEIRDLLAK
jgi:large conductance mechanosensitive channel